MKGYRFVIRGRVQGVGFRAWVQRTARDYDLVGSVRNRMDGSVEIDASGPPSSIARLRDALHLGPPLARVDEVAETEIEMPSVHSFSIDR